MSKYQYGPSEAIIPDIIPHAKSPLGAICAITHPGQLHWEVRYCPEVVALDMTNNVIRTLRLREYYIFPITQSA